MACTSPPTAAECVAAAPPASAPAFAAGLLYQWTGTNAEGESSGLRIYQDGRIERQRRGQGWESMSSVSVEKLSGLQAAVATVQSGAYQRSTPPDGGSVQWVQVQGASGPQSVYIGPGCEVAALADVFAAAAALVSAVR